MEILPNVFKGAVMRVPCAVNRGRGLNLVCRMEETLKCKLAG